MYVCKLVCFTLLFYCFNLFLFVLFSLVTVLLSFVLRERGGGGGVIQQCSLFAIAGLTQYPYNAFSFYRNLIQIYFVSRNLFNFYIDSILFI